MYINHFHKKLIFFGEIPNKQYASGSDSNKQVETIDFLRTLIRGDLYSAVA